MENIEQLIDERNLSKFDDLLRIITSDLMNEGVSKEDIFEYITSKIENV